MRKKRGVPDLLQNLLGHLLGLDHELTYDRHTNVLYDSLVEKTRETILQILFRYMTPQGMIDEVAGKCRSYTEFAAR